MSFIFDRLYGKLNFPEIIERLLDCPGLLRLREIGMGNINFLSFPSFSAVTRYEHSLGVCHLAGLASKSLGLSAKNRIELMIAALYHDVTTPPFAHAMEELLSFDHEKHFYELLTGQSEDLGGPYAQVFQGRALKLLEVCQSSQARKIGIDLFRIPELVFGKKNDPLSSLICGDIDLDNIDNVVRAGSAMGVKGLTGSITEVLANSFVFYNGEKIGISEAALNYLHKWKSVRKILYDMILCSIDDFSLQTMLKHALSFLIEVVDSSIGLDAKDWKTTEEEIIRTIVEHPYARDIYRRMRLKDLYVCVSLVWIKGPGVLEYIKNKEKQQKLERLSQDILHIQTIMNYYLDKRERRIGRPFVFFNKVRQNEEGSLEEPALLVGFFTPGRTNFVDRNTGKRFIDIQRKQEFLRGLKELLPNWLSLYTVRLVTTGEYPQARLGERIK